jgi:hypothetical protein
MPTPRRRRGPDARHATRRMPARSRAGPRSDRQDSGCLAPWHDAAGRHGIPRVGLVHAVRAVPVARARLHGLDCFSPTGMRREGAARERNGERLPADRMPMSDSLCAARQRVPGRTIGPQVTIIANRWPAIHAPRRRCRGGPRPGLRMSSKERRRGSEREQTIWARLLGPRPVVMAAAALGVVIVVVARAQLVLSAQRTSDSSARQRFENGAVVRGQLTTSLLSTSSASPPGMSARVATSPRRRSMGRAGGSCALSRHRCCTRASTVRARGYSRSSSYSPARSAARA